MSQFRQEFAGGKERILNGLEEEELLDRLIDCIRDINQPGEPPEARKNAHDSIQELSRFSGGPGPFLRKFMKGWTEETLGHAIADLDVLEIELASRGY